MYNRYINGSFDDYFRPVDDAPMPLPQMECLAVDAPQPPAPPPKSAGLLGGLLGGLNLPEFNMDTVILLVLVYFLVTDEAEQDSDISDTLLIVGILLLLGF